MLACYDVDGNLDSTAKNVREFLEQTPYTELKASGIYRSLKLGVWYKDFLFVKYKDNPKEKINEKPYYCIIDDYLMNGPTDAADYLGVSKQAVDQAKKRKAATIMGKAVIWS